MSLEELSKNLGAFFPILVYVCGRIIERVLVGAYRKWTGKLVFKEDTRGDMAILTVRTNSSVILDEVNVHLEDRLLDVLKKIKEGLKFDAIKRVEFSPLDRVRFECILQKDGDKKLLTYAYVGPSSTFFEEDLDVKYRSALDFMYNTEMSIVTSEKTYRRNLFKRDC